VKRGDKLICLKCNSHIATLTRDVHVGDALCEAIFKADEGQGPWKNGELTNCRKCNSKFFEENFFKAKFQTTN
jgi:ribosomal protein L40E